MKRIDTILFDNDGTIVDTHDLIMESFYHATRIVLGREVTEQEVMATGSRPLAEQMRMLARTDAEAEELVSVYRDYNHAIHDERISLFEGVAEGLDRLHAKGYRMGIVTSKMHWLAWRGLEATGVAKYFDCLVGADDCPRHKPDPAPILQAARILGCKPDECAYVGDSPFDMAAANAAGCTSIAALWGMFSREDLAAECPDSAYETFSRLAELL